MKLNLCLHLFCLLLLYCKSGLGNKVAYEVNSAVLNVTVEGNGLGQFSNSNGSKITVLTLSEMCVKCDFHKVLEFKWQNGSDSVLVDARWPIYVKIQLSTSEDKWICNATKKTEFRERGSYLLSFQANITSKDEVNCNIKSLKAVKQPKNANIPILVAFLIYLFTAIVFVVGNYVYQKTKARSVEMFDNCIDSDLGNSKSVQLNAGDNYSKSSSDTQQLIKPKATAKERLSSIDTFRGMCIVIMIFVNYGGGKYWFFSHSVWNGLTVADLVFPWFMFIMGINIVLSIDSQLMRSMSMKLIIYKIVRRTVILFALGIFIINGNYAWYNIRIPGVLQRFSIAYFVVCFLQLFFHTTNLELEKYVHLLVKPWWFPVRDIVLYWQQWIFMICLEAVWLSLTFALPVPNCPTGYIGPGGLADNGTNFNCTGGAAGYIDRKVFGNIHLFDNPTCKEVYFPMYTHGEPVHYDPEGLLGTINSCFIVFLGLQAGKIFYYFKSVKERVVRFSAWFLFLGIISAVLTKCSMNDGWIPVNKNLWSITFVTTLSGMAFFLIPIFYYTVDVKKIWSGAPLYFVGMNSILVYVGHETFEKYLPFSWGADQYSTHTEWLTMNLLGVTYWVLIAYYCHIVKFYLKI